MGFLMKTDISENYISPTTGLDIIVVVLTSGLARRYYIYGLRPLFLLMIADTHKN